MNGPDRAPDPDAPPAVAPSGRRDGDAAGSERAAWITLAAVDGIGGILLARLVAHLGSAAAVLAAARGADAQRFAREVRTAAAVPVRTALAPGIIAAAATPEAIHARLDALGMWAIVPWDPVYPAALRRIDDPPPVLFGRGRVEDLSEGALVAVVGTRRPSPTGRLLAMRLGLALAEAGVTVVSGLAVGIDGIAHSGALDADGRTVAVIGGGVAAGIPRAHRALAARIAGQGVIVGEHPPDTVPTRGTFPRRNRIVSGLAHAVVVVEAPARSGALITARLALEQGRAVFAMPGRPGDGSVAGCLALLRETPTRVVAGIDELLVDLASGDGLGSGTDEGHAVSRQTRRPPPLAAGEAIALLGPVEAGVARRLCAGPVSIDDLVKATGHPPAVVAGALTLLQLRGWADALGPLQVPAGPLVRGRVAAGTRRQEASHESAPTGEVPAGGQDQPVIATPRDAT